MSGWRDFVFTSIPGDKAGKGDNVAALGQQEAALSASSLLSPRRSKWIPLTAAQCQALKAKYSDDRELWNRFWLYMGEQVDKGAPYEYVLASYEALERVWNDGTTQGAT